jgi:hypothetical protein
MDLDYSSLISTILPKSYVVDSKEEDEVPKPPLEY